MAYDISESGWKAFTKKQKLDLDDRELLKALAAFDRTDVARPEPRLQALNELIEQGRKQMLALARKKKDIEKELGAKTFAAAKDELDELIEAAEKLLKQAREAQQQAQGAAEEADSPALLTGRMVPLIRELRKGQVTMSSLIAVAGKETVVLISKRAISPASGKLLKEQMSSPGGLKFIRGDCLFEENTLTFVVQAPAAGLAKKLKAALLAQTGLRLKVRVRGEGPEDVEEEGGEEEGGDEQTAAAPGPGQGVPIAPPQPSVTYERKLAELLPRVKQAAAAGGSPDAAKHRVLLDYAAGKAREADFLGAVAALRRLEQMLDKPAEGAVQTDGAAAAAFNARLAALVPALKGALAAGLAQAPGLKLQVSEAGVLAHKKDFARATALLAEVERALGSAATPVAPADGVAAAATEQPPAPTARWEAERAKVVARLRREIKAVVASGDPDAGQAELELMAVIKQLAGEMQTRRQAAEMTRYLLEDEVVADVSELAFDLKTRLQGVLAEISPQLAA